MLSSSSLTPLSPRFDNLEKQILQLRTEMHDGFSAIGNDLRTEFQVELRALGTEMRVSHEDVIARLQLIQESQADQQAPRKRKPRRRKE